MNLKKYLQKQRKNYMAERNLDFDKVINRKNTRCLKYDFAVKRGKPADVLPLWVADMDFETSSYIEDALVARAKEGIFGYSEVQTPYFEIIANWMKLHHNWEIQEDWLIKTPGVVFALAMAVKAYTQPGDSVLIQLPVYYPFSEVIQDNGRKVVSSNLYQGEDNRYHIDFQDFEKKIVEENVKLFFLCNPHNPIGKVLTLAEEQRLCELAERYDVRIFNDEIHAPFVFEGRHIPYPTISEAAARQSMTATSASKSFNIPGTKCAQVLLTNPADREMWAERAEWSEHQTATIGAIATTTAYNEGDPWFQDALSYVRRNLGLFDEQMSTRFSGVGYIRPRGTYIAWLDFGPLGIDDPAAYFLEKAKVALTDGRSCGRAGAGCVRVNMAMPYPLLVDCLNRMHDALQADGLL